MIPIQCHNIDVKILGLNWIDWRVQVFQLYVAHIYPSKFIFSFVDKERVCPVYIII